MQVWRIECLLHENAKSDDAIIREMAERMKVKFSKYWDEYSTILAMGAVFDPRMKFDALRFCYSKLDPSTCEEKLAHIKSKMYKLYQEYAKENQNESAGSSSQQLNSA